MDGTIEYTEYDKTCIRKTNDTFCLINVVIVPNLWMCMYNLEQPQKPRKYKHICGERDLGGIRDK